MSWKASSPPSLAKPSKSKASWKASKTVKIQGLLESEGNREREDDKANRVDLLALMDDKAKVIIEVQNNTETAYFQRMIFGTSKVLCDYINKGENYEHVSKVYSVNIVYFALGKGSDYVYHGKTEFRGIHNGDILQLNPFQKEKFEKVRGRYCQPALP